MPVPILEPTHRSSNRKNMAHEASNVRSDSLGFHRGSQMQYQACFISREVTFSLIASTSPIAYVELDHQPCCPNMSSFRANTKPPPGGAPFAFTCASRLYGRIGSYQKTAPL